jgi:tetratricopeptide (TPR) repeat protein
MINDELLQLAQTLATLSSTHRYDLIIDTARKILALDMQSELAHLCLIRAMYGMQKFDDMHAALVTAGPYFSGNAWFHHMFYLYYLFVGGEAYMKAKEHIEEAIRLEPWNSTYHRSLGEIYLINREPAKAAGPLEEAVKLDPNNPEYRSRFALALLRMHRVAKSLETANKALKDGPDKPWVYDSVGMIYTLSGSLEKGDELFRVALRMDPTNEYFQRHLDWVGREMKDRNTRHAAGKTYTPLYLRQKDTSKYF